MNADEVEDVYARWLANPTDGGLLADLFEAVTGKRPVVEEGDDESE